MKKTKLRVRRSSPRDVKDTCPSSIVLPPDFSSAYYDFFFEGALDPHPLELMAGDPDNPGMLHCTNIEEPDHG